MKLLVDTHVLLWWVQDDPRLARPARHAIEVTSNEVFVSAASIWELAIKIALRRLKWPESVSLDGVITDCGFQELPVTARHAAAVRELPLLHADPFDRLLVAQAQIEVLTLVTSDPDVRRYDVAILGAGAESG